MSASGPSDPIVAAMPSVPSGPPSLARLTELYERFGQDHYDEDLSQLDHALQTAALAEAAGASDELVVAALLHDVGHLLALEAHASRGGRTEDLASAPEDLEHEAVGARWLARLFPPAVTALIALHVRAKRYRCAVDPAYHDGLSDGSRRSLVKQGGPFDEGEAVAFAALPGFADAVALRGWDDAGKVDGLVTPGWQHHLPLLASAQGNRAR